MDMVIFGFKAIIAIIGTACATGIIIGYFRIIISDILYFIKRKRRRDHADPDTE